MKPHFALIPLASVMICVPAHAEIYFTVERAQAAMFPGETMTPAFRTLSDGQAAAIEKETDVNVRNREVKAWRTSSGGWFVADEVVGKHEFITFALALDKDGAVKGVEILEYREAYGGQVRDPAWRAQFTGKRHGAALRLTDDIQNVSGATLSCRHVTDGVKRLLATYALALAGSAG